MKGISECWNHIISELGSRSKDFTTWSVYRSRNKNFTARVTGNTIIVEGNDITTPRIISYSEFECVAKLYDLYTQRKPGVRPTMRDECGFNSSYIITLIHEFCEH